MTLRLRGRVIIAVGVAMITGTASGCSTKTEELRLPDKNIDQWVLPLDPYMSIQGNPIGDAEGILVRKCMDKAGYSWPFVSGLAEAPRGESWSADGHKLFTPELALKYGYGNSNEYNHTPAQKDAWDDFVSIANGLSEDGAASLEACYVETRKAIGTVDDPTRFAQSLQGHHVRSQYRQRVKEAEHRWRSCMRPAGVADLPDSPRDMTPSRFLPRSSIPEVDAPVVLTDREREVAVRDAECQESSGWLRAEYDAVWDEQARQIREHADELERNRRAYESQRRRAQEIIAANNAPQPTEATMSN